MNKEELRIRAMEIAASLLRGEGVLSCTPKAVSEMYETIHNLLKPEPIIVGEIKTVVKSGQSDIPPTT